MRHVLARFSRSLRLLGLLLPAFLVAGSCTDGPTAPDDLSLEPVRVDASRAPADGPDLAAAIRVQERHTPRLLDADGIVGTGVGLTRGGRAVIRVYTVGPEVKGVPDRLDGVPVARVVTGLFRVGSDPTSRARPAPVGFSVGHVDITAGTIGARVRDGAGNVFLLSNNHVLANSNAAGLGDPILQPGPFDGGTDPADRIGTLDDYEPIDFSLSGQNYVDAALAAVAAADLDVSTPPDGYGTPSATPYPLDADADGTVDGGLLGQAVQKFGRTTGLTRSQVTEVNVTVEVCYEVLLIFCSKSAYFYDQVGFGALSQGGDSGSLIVTDDEGVHPVALLFAGSDTRTLGNRIDRVLSTFGVSVDDGSTDGGDGGDGNASPTASFTSSCTDLSCSFDGSGSSDPDGAIVSWDWTFGDGAAGSGATTSHAYASAGSYDVTLTVTDDLGATGRLTKTVDVGSPSTSEPTLTASKRKVKGEHVVDLAWSGVPWPEIHVFRDGVVVEVLPGSAEGSYSDFTGQKGKATYTHFVCEGTALDAICSNPVFTSY